MQNKQESALARIKTLHGDNQEAGETSQIEANQLSNSDIDQILDVPATLNNNTD